MHDPKVIRGRFAVEDSADGPTVVDYAYGLCLSWDSKAEAQRVATFSRAYARRHGDINFDSFPMSISEPLTEDDRQYLRALVV